MTLQELNLSRRSIEHFDPDKSIDMELLKRIINEANYAPSGHNLQPWRLIVVKSKEAKERLNKHSYSQKKIMDAPITLIIVGDKEAYLEGNIAYEEVVELYGQERKDAIIASATRVYGKDEISKVKFAYLNTSLFIMNLMLLLKAYGIESHAIGGMNPAKVHEEFKLKESEEAVMLLSIGYFDETKTLSTRKRRKTFSQMTTVE